MFVVGCLVIVLVFNFSSFWYLDFSILYGKAGRPRPFCCVVGYFGIVEIFVLCDRCVCYKFVGGCYILSGFCDLASCLGLSGGYSF